MAYDSDLVRTKNWSSEVLTDSDLEGQFDLIINWVMAALNSSTGHAHDGTSNHGPKIPITNLTVGSQALGDTIYSSSSSAMVRLAGNTTTTKKFLTQTGDGAASAAPAWTDPVAVQSDQETATSTTLFVTPGRQQFHPSASKAWCYFDGTATGTNAPTVGYGVTSVTRNGAGDYTVNLSITMSSSNYPVLVTMGTYILVGVSAANPVNATSCRIGTFNVAGTPTDSPVVSVMILGDI